VVQGDEAAVCYSGFVVELCGSWCYVTAGHIFEDEIRTGVESGQVRINKWFLADYFGPNPVVREPIPFDFDGAGKTWLHRSDLGLDFALVHLRTFFRQSLAANGVIPITRLNWAAAEHLQHNSHAVIGIPAALSVPGAREGERGGQIGLMVKPTLVWIDKLDEVPDGVVPPEAEWFVGQVCVPMSMKGMSGGPIFGYRRNPEGQLSYHAVAVQSGWFEKAQVILGCPLPRFMRIVEEGLEEEFRRNITSESDTVGS
jgi:hypothetical protein